MADILRRSSSSSSSSSSLLIALTLALLLTICRVSLVQARVLEVLVPYDRIIEENDQDRMGRSLETSLDECASTEEEKIGLMQVDRLCETCQEMYRHIDPNLRAKCRRNCFDNDEFVFCFNHFAGDNQIARTNGDK